MPVLRRLVGAHRGDGGARRVGPPAGALPGAVVDGTGVGAGARLRRRAQAPNATAAASARRAPRRAAGASGRAGVVANGVMSVRMGVRSWGA